jgi:hypothetical protein
MSREYQRSMCNLSLKKTALNRNQASKFQVFVNWAAQVDSGDAYHREAAGAQA